MSRSAFREDSEISPGPVPAEVLKFWREKKLKPSFSYLDTWGDEHGWAFSAAKMMRQDVLALMQSEIDRAILGGIPFHQWQKEIAPKLDAVGWWKPHYVVDPQTGKTAHVDPPRRLQIIFDTNMRTARAVGQWDRIQRNRRYRPYLLYIHNDSAHPRPHHVAWHGILLPADDEWWLSHFVPNGWGCHCEARSVSKREASELESEGILEAEPTPLLDADGNPTGQVVDKRVPVKTTAPKSKMVPFLNHRTGRMELVPEGVDPGFQHPPGEGRRRALSEAAG